MTTPKITTKTPIRLQDAVCKAFAKEYEQMIEEHGASYAVNVALRKHLIKAGYAIPEIPTRNERIASAQLERWASVKGASTEEEERLERKRELKRKRDKRYRERKRTEKTEKEGSDQ